MDKIAFWICMTFVAMGIFIVLQGEGIGWLVIGFFGLCALVGLPSLLPEQWFARLPSGHFLRRLRGEVEVPDPKLGVLAADEEGFTHTVEQQTHRVDWVHVGRIFTYKLDLFSTDCICLCFEYGGANDGYQIHEEMAGFMDVADSRRKRFPQIPAGWFMDVAVPAFETKLTVLYPASKGVNEVVESA